MPTECVGLDELLTSMQAGLPSPPKTYKPMMKGVYVAYAVVAWYDLHLMNSMISGTLHLSRAYVCILIQFALGASLPLSATLCWEEDFAEPVPNHVVCVTCFASLECDNGVCTRSEVQCSELMLSYCPLFVDR